MNAAKNKPEPALPRLPRRRAESHKGDYGRALLIGGSRGMTGAIGLAGMAALRGGAGLVKLAVPDVCQAVVAGYEPSYMTVALPSSGEGRLVAAAQEGLGDLIDEATAVAVGPGLGRSSDLDALVAWLYTDVAKPAVFDADALNALAEQPAILARPGGPRILTPHPGEFARLVGAEEATPKRRRERAVQLAADCGAIVVLKGHQSLVTDGRQSAQNTTGNPGMATGGTGDVLTGLVTALLCQGLTPWDAARLAVHVHGLAGDLAAARLGEVSLIACDLVRKLPAAFQSLETNGEPGA